MFDGNKNNEDCVFVSLCIKIHERVSLKARSSFTGSSSFSPCSRRMLFVCDHQQQIKLQEGKKTSLQITVCVLLGKTRGRDQAG
jgi:hypothetical protein